MATQVQLRRGNTTQTNAFTGAVAEITIDTTKNTIVVHDGSVAGGYPLARESAVIIAGSYANSAFLQANTPSYTANSAASYANSAFLKANTPDYVANSASSYANGAFTKANTAYTTAVAASADGLAFAIALG
jgi:hypothetical protein